MDENEFVEYVADEKSLNELKPEEIMRIMNELKVPEELCQEIEQGSSFIAVLKKWSGHNAFLFHQSLNSIRPDLIPVACKAKWLCVSSEDQVELREEDELSIKTLIALLKREVSKVDWELIYIAVADEAGENVNFEITLNKLMEKGCIEKDLCTLKRIFVKIERYDLVNKLDAYQKEFKDMEEGEFESKFKKEVGTQAKELKQWEGKLKDFGKSQFQKVSQMLGEEKQEWLESVFVDLTILKEKPRPINMEDETTYNEIAYLRKIANKEVEIEPVDFTKELVTYEAEKPEIWCLIGNPGCGKTFLAKRTALRFSSDELANIQIFHIHTVSEHRMARYGDHTPCRRKLESRN